MYSIRDRCGIACKMEDVDETRNLLLAMSADLSRTLFMSVWIATTSVCMRMAMMMYFSESDESHVSPPGHC